MNQSDLSPLERLRIADPDTFVRVKGRLAMIDPPPDEETMAWLADATIWGLSQEAGLGAAVAQGMLFLMAKMATHRIPIYDKLVRRAARTGPTLGRIMATFLPPVLMSSDAFLDRFNRTVEVMQQKGTYTLTAPLEAMAELLAEGDETAAFDYLHLLADIFSRDITYNHSLRLVYTLPKAVTGFDARRRNAQIKQLHMVAMRDLKLVEPFLDGLMRGTGLLDDAALEDFVNQALARYAQQPEASIKFLSLASKVGKDACAALRRVVPLSHVSAQLNRYLYARIGRSVAVKPLEALPNGKDGIPWACSDGRHIFLPDEIDRFSTQMDNVLLYKALSRLEAGFFEYRTFDFDLEKAIDRYAEVALRIYSRSIEAADEGICDGERFLNVFTPSALAKDLFNLYEQARIMHHLRVGYPGLVRQVTPILDDADLDGDDLLAPVFSQLNFGGKQSVYEDAEPTGLQRRLVEIFLEEIDDDSTVETTALLVCRAFDLISQKLGTAVNRYRSMSLPFSRRLHWDLVSRAFAAQDRTAQRIKVKLKELGWDLYRSDLRNRLAEKHGALSADDISELVLVRTQGEPSVSSAIDLSDLDLAALLSNSGAEVKVSGQTDGEAFCYPEWDCNLQDYLYDHTRVYEADVPGDSGGALYSQLLEQHNGLVASIRRAFELLKPDGLTLLRQWPEGDAFDYRALLDFVMDRRAGRIPSDRLFIKRLKQERDVAVMLLVDLSRSTANAISGGHRTVLDVTQEALVLFCEALEVVGDDYAIAGFSGTGRHCVDFYGIKRFREPLCEAVRSRISNLKPQRSTRMGAAIRHAGSLLAHAEARIRLMIVVSDGFPNDIGYKSDYAIADTRRSIQEARSRNFHVKAITVNIGSDPRLDDLYGRNHHHVIGDVHDLPGKLVRLYGTLTRF